LASSDEAIAPLRCAKRSPSDGNASTIQKVVVSVRSANQAMVPCSWMARLTASARKVLNRPGSDGF
jgi:hypothetical protein